MPLAAIKSNPYYEQLMGTLKTHVKADRMYPRQMANTLWAFAKIESDKDDIIDALLEQTERVGRTSYHRTGTISACRTSACWGLGLVIISERSRLYGSMQVLKYYISDNRNKGATMTHPPQTLWRMPKFRPRACMRYI